MLDPIISFINNVLWGDYNVLIVLLVLAGLWFSVALGGVLFRHFGHMFRLLRGSTESDKDGIRE